MIRGTIFSVLLSCGFFVHDAAGQQPFELVVPGTGQVSRAERSDPVLRIEDSDGNVTAYRRAPRHDSPDGAWWGYASETAQQVIRWPASDRGGFQIARGGTSPLVFRPSQMEIRALGPMALPVALEDIEPRTAYRLVPVSPSAGGRAMAIDTNGRLVLRPVAEEDSQIWHFTPLSPGLVRIHSDLRGSRWSLSSRPDASLRLAVTADAADQIWRLMAVPGDPGHVVLARVGPTVLPHVLTCPPAGHLLMQQRDWSVGQCFRLIRMGPRWPPVFAEYRFISRDIRPNPPLPPAQVELTNSHAKEVWIVLFDRQRAGQGTRIKLLPGKSQLVSLERDSGATLVETFERGSVLGVSQRDEFVTALPPDVRYDVSVYELIVQSIAIDSTVPGGKVEDVQHAPRSLGWFELPPGGLLRDGPLDVFVAAKEQKNPGQVRRINPQEWRMNESAPDPVESLLKRSQK